MGLRLMDSDLTALRATGLARTTVAGVTAAVGLAGARWWTGRMGALFLAAALVWLPWPVMVISPWIAQPMSVVAL